MEKQWACKICSKTFSSGKAMGGHMRSHLAKLPLPPPKLPYQVVPSFSTPPSSSLLSYRSVTSSLSGSDADSYSRIHRKRRSKRRRKFAIDDEPNSEQVSSVSETFSKEEVAWSLLMLSRDLWVREKKLKIEEDEEEDSVEERVDEEVSSEEDDDSVRRSKKRPANYKCDTCDKVFGSYQALGGHKASHKKMNIAKEEADEVSNGGYENRGSKLVVKNRIFQCPFCVKVFDSGQALGGHKKVHYSQTGSSKVSSSSSSKFGEKLLDLDLNLPPAEFDDEQSQAQNSTISSGHKPVGKQFMQREGMHAMTQSAEIRTGKIEIEMRLQKKKISEDLENIWWVLTESSSILRKKWTARRKWREPIFLAPASLMKERSLMQIMESKAETATAIKRKMTLGKTKRRRFFFFMIKP